MFSAGQSAAKNVALKFGILLNTFKYYLDKVLCKMKSQQLKLVVNGSDSWKKVTKNIFIKGTILLTISEEFSTTWRGLVS